MVNLVVKVALNNELILAKLNEHNINSEEFKDLLKKAVDFTLEQVADGSKRSDMERLIDNVIYLAQRSVRDAWEKPPYCLPKQGEIMMDIAIKNMQAIRLAVLEHRGDPKSAGYY